ncbi:hypothetical protein, partial [Treponema putidum]|uniref:hypothetical protein n=1 Tax=Treponema putidum TaxID=221027 RepID=UPI003D8A28F6
AMIKIEHPEALSDIQRVVHITKEGESGGGGGNTGNTSIKRISTDPNLISVKLGETKTVTAKIIDENDHTLQVDNSKFEWSIVMGKDKIKIKPNGKSCEITRIAATGDETVMIKITHPNADKEAKEFVY